MSVLLAIEVTIIAAAVVGMFRLRRIADQAWENRRQRALLVSITLDATGFIAACAAASAGIQRMVTAAADMERSMQRVSETLRARDGATR